MNFNDLPDDDFDDNLPSARWGRLRVLLFSGLMVSILLGSALVEGWSLVPWLLGYWNNTYSVQITHITDGDCLHSKRRSATGVYPTSVVCVCGRLAAAQSSADFDLHLLDSSGGKRGVLALRDTPSGAFCRPLYADGWLLPGEYFVVAKPRLWRGEVARVRFWVIEDGRSI